MLESLLNSVFLIIFMNSTRQIKLGAVISYLSIAINMIAGLLYTPWMIRIIGKGDYGLYTLAMSVISLFVFDFGLGVSINRFLSKYLAEGRQDKANQCLGMVYKLYFYIDIVLLIVLTTVYFFIAQIYQELTPIEMEKFKIVYAMAAFFAVFSFPFIPINGILSAHEKFVQLKLCDVIHKLIVVGAMSFCLFVGYGLYALILVNALAGIIMIAMKLYFIKRYTSQKIDFMYKNREEFRQIVGFSGWVTIMSFCQRCIFTLGPTILGAFSGSAAIAIFGIASTLEGYVFTFSSALSGMFLPRVSRIVAKDGDVLPLMIKIGRIQLMLVSFVVLGFCCVGFEFIQLWVGEDFSLSYLCTLFIIIPSILQLPQEIGDQTLYAKNKLRERSYAFISMAVANVVLGIPLSIFFGAVGLCFSICMAYLIRTIVLDIIYKNVLHIDICKFFKETFVVFLPAFILCLVVCFALNHFVCIGGWLSIGIKGIIYCVIMITSLFFFVMNKEEKEFVLFPIRKFFL